MANALGCSMLNPSSVCQLVESWSASVLPLPLLPPRENHGECGTRLPISQELKVIRSSPEHCADRHNGGFSVINTGVKLFKKPTRPNGTKQPQNLNITAFSHTPGFVRGEFHRLET